MVKRIIIAGILLIGAGIWLARGAMTTEFAGEGEEETVERPKQDRPINNEEARFTYPDSEETAPLGEIEGMKFPSPEERIAEARNKSDLLVEQKVEAAKLHHVPQWNHALAMPDIREIRVPDPFVDSE